MRLRFNHHRVPNLRNGAWWKLIGLDEEKAYGMYLRLNSHYFILWLEQPLWKWLVKHKPVIRIHTIGAGWWETEELHEYTGELRDEGSKRQASSGTKG